MTTTSCALTTDHGSKYLQQLCKHFGHKIPATFTETAGQITFPDLGVVDLAADDRGLTLTLTSASGERLDTLKDVVVRHLDRFAFRETLAYDWQVAAG